MTCEQKLKISLKRTQKSFDLPIDYVVSKFYELGYKVSHLKHNDTYLSCCPICHEGKSWGRKKRCYYIPANNNIFCHNCGSSLTTYRWIREVSGMSDKELRKDVESGAFEMIDLNVKAKEPQKTPTLPEDSINLFDPAQTEFYENDKIVRYATQYIKDRRLDTAINRPHALYISLKDFTHKNRLIIPFKEESDQIVFYQSRKLFNYDERGNYISKINSNKTIYGIERVTTDIDTVFLFEGPIDASFIKNGLGVAGITKGVQRFTDIQEEQLESLKFFDKIWVLDSQWLDETARTKTEILLNLGERVFIWPKGLGKKFKDLNELCIHHELDQVSSTFIKKNTTMGNSGILKFKTLMSKL